MASSTDATMAYGSLAASVPENVEEATMPLLHEPETMMNDVVDPSSSSSSGTRKYWLIGSMVAVSTVVLMASNGSLSSLSSSTTSTVTEFLNTQRLSMSPLGGQEDKTTVSQTPKTTTATTTSTASTTVAAASSSSVATSTSTSTSTPITVTKTATAVTTTTTTPVTTSKTTTVTATITPVVATTMTSSSTPIAATVPTTTSTTPTTTTKSATVTTTTTPATTSTTPTASGNKPGNIITQNTVSAPKSTTASSSSSSSSTTTSSMKSSSKKGTSKFPNIVFVLADDLGYSQIGIAKDDPAYFEFDLDWAAPRLTELAKQGIVMKNYYSQEVCTPARAALLTGRYPLSIGMQYGVVDTRTPWGLNPSEQTIADVLNENGYVTKALGKWHLGHHSPKFLPTARGFDSFTGYMNGDNYYYSKRNPLEYHFVDFLTMDKDTYCPYTEDDLHLYSTHFYRKKALETIENHDQSSPLFLYLPFQAVHDPFADFVQQRDNAKNYVTDDVRAMVRKNVVGAKREDYAYALNLLDGAVGAIQDKLVETGMMDNTYFIFASDNGGCYSAGGKNGPYRGTKGTIFEGGTKVDAFIYSPLLKESQRGKVYEGLMHVSDWFPTLIELAGVPYTPRSGFDLDGVSQVSSWETNVPARTEMLYNSVHNVKNKGFDVMTNGWFAVRNEQYKLVTTNNYHNH